MAMKVRKPAYADVLDLDLRLYVSDISHSPSYSIHTAYKAGFSSKGRRLTKSDRGEFEKNVPFSLRCRAALLVTPSRYPQIEAAIESSPEPSRRSLAISFQVWMSPIGLLSIDANKRQQTNLSLNISETIINLHRPYYAKALHEVDRVESVYKPSFYTVIERCGVRPQPISSLYVSPNIGADYYQHRHRYPRQVPGCKHQAMEPMGENLPSSELCFHSN